MARDLSVDAVVARARSRLRDARVNAGGGGEDVAVRPGAISERPAIRVDAQPGVLVVEGGTAQLSVEATVRESGG